MKLPPIVLIACAATLASACQDNIASESRPAQIRGTVDTYGYETTYAKGPGQTFEGVETVNIKKSAFGPGLWNVSFTRRFQPALPLLRNGEIPFGLGMRCRMEGGDWSCVCKENASTALRQVTIKGKSTGAGRRFEVAGVISFVPARGGACRVFDGSRVVAKQSSYDIQYADIALDTDIPTCAGTWAVRSPQDVSTYCR